MVKVKTMGNGVRVVSERMEHVRSVSIGVWVDTGSVRECGSEQGASHLIEHMVFKGTERRSAQQIAAEMDAVGGNLMPSPPRNAPVFTPRCSTSICRWPVIY